MASKAKMLKAQKQPKYKVRHRNRCRICGRPRGYIRLFGVCRICFRRMSLNGDVPGVRKSSW